MQNIKVGMIVLGSHMNDEILMVENNGFYSLPEISIETSEYNNIVDIAYDLSKRIGIKVDEMFLVYVLEQKIPNSEDIIITYYFAVMVDIDTENNEYKWVSQAYNKMDTTIYPQEFIDKIRENLVNGWKISAKVIKQK